MTSKSPVCTPPATKGAARAVAAPAAPALGAGTRRKALMQSGAGMLNGWHSIAILVEGMPQRDAAAPSKRSAGAAATRGIQTLPVGNHGENLNESQA